MRILNVGTDQLFRAPPVVMPHNHVGLVPEPPPSHKPSVAQVIVFGCHVQPRALVEASERQQGIAPEGHVGRI
jgi:hypothetical protein